jgi:oxygen-independent coproporphyrinogen-3 oxidase
MKHSITDLLKKYNVPGPRYTSYPTVPYWEQNPTAEEWIASIADSLQSGQGNGGALYIHIPFCRSLCTYCGCNTRISRNNAVSAPYVETVLKEWKLYQEALAKVGFEQAFPLSELHLGGGTPTFLSSAELERLVSGILENSRMVSDSEFSIEADPRVTTREHLITLARLGFKRLSLGIQDFDPKVQDIVHRIQSEEQVREVTDTARELGFSSINYDLIYGLPLQTRQSIEKTIQAVVRLKPTRIAFYAYAHVPWIKPGQRRFTEADLPGGDEKRALYELGRELLEAAGYHEIGMDHFALEEDSLSVAARTGALHRNFMGYTSRQVAPLIGLGVSAIGDSWSAFAQNEKLVEVYQARVEKGELPIHRGHILNEEDRILRRHILNLMTRFHTEWSKNQDYAPFLESVPGALAELEKDELLKLAPGSCSVTEQGRAFLRNICMAFDARLVRKAPQTKLFSQTI